ncbi:MAG: efflux RND transporter permease subunit [Planctomycetaceae bacterium]|jgi:multidrug efflux pump subunit AcrB|nr:efflux RND transporter permease subunit [Planctomycetaceae bacterium]
MFSKFAVENRVTVGFFVVLIVLGGVWSYLSMGRLEDPEFTVKSAGIITFYPGASAQDVNERVTPVVERHVRKVKGVKDIRSISRPGVSIIYADIQNSFPPEKLPNVWQELRNKMSAVKPELPPETLSPIVQDDFGDVFGILLALTGDGFSDAEIRDHAKKLQNELFHVDQVGRVELWGERKECIEVEISQAKMSELSIHPSMILYSLASYHLEFNAGEMTLGQERLRIDPSGTFNSIEEIGNLIIPNSQSGVLVQGASVAVPDAVPSPMTGAAQRMLGRRTLEPIRLRDIATVRRTYVDPPKKMMRSNGKSAVLIAIAPVSGGDVIEMGKNVREKTAEILKTFPVGYTIDTVCYQPDNVAGAVSAFERNLREAVVIVTVVVMLTMGFRSGLLITSSLLIVMLGTLCVLFPMGVVLQRTSLGAFIVALGILVDDAVVVGDKILVMMQRGTPRKEACIEGAKRVGNQLLGATIVGALAFLPIYLSPDATGEYARDIFIVLAVSLTISWFVAMMQTPVVYYLFVPASRKTGQREAHNGVVYRAYRRALEWVLRHKTVTFGALLMATLAAVIMAPRVRKIFFPVAQRAQFLIEYRLPEGASIHAIEADAKLIETYLMKLDTVSQVSAFIGSGPPRFYLPYEPVIDNSAYGCFLVNVGNVKETERLIPPATEWLAKNFPKAYTRVIQFRLGPSTQNDLEVRFSGQDSRVLRRLSERAKEILRAESIAGPPQEDWRQLIPVWKPVYSSAKGLQAMTSRAEMNMAIRWATLGLPAATFNEGDNLMPILLRGTTQERNSIEQIANIPVWGLSSESVPLGQITTGGKIEWQEAEIHRYNGVPTLTVGANARYGYQWNELFEKTRERLEALRKDIPPGYRMEWGGQFEKSRDAQNTLLSQLPVALLFMATIVVALFNSTRQPLIILLTFPLAFVGVTFGLLITGTPFGFMALVGAMSLIGMIVRNGVVLIDQIDAEIAQSGSAYGAIIDASVERLRPVTVAAMTVVVGMIPLLRDPLFDSMAAAIMFGLIFATLMTLFVVPALYMIFFRIRIPKK